MSSHHTTKHKTSRGSITYWQQFTRAKATLLFNRNSGNWTTGWWINLPLLILGSTLLDPGSDLKEALFIAMAYTWSVLLWGWCSWVRFKGQHSTNRTSVQAAAEKSLDLLQTIDKQCIANLERASNISGEAVLNMLDRVHNVHVQSEKVVGYLSSSNKQSAQIQDVIEKNTKLIQSIYNFIQGLENKVAEEKHRSVQLMNEVKQFSQMTTVIRSIAHQTEILAINARIEAARAGDAGQGFAVLAAEVRRLSIQSNETAIRIDQDINRLQQSVQKQVNNDSLSDQIHSQEFGAGNILELTKELSDSYVDIRDFYQILINSITEHNIRLNEDIQVLLDMGQHQDVFRQIIDRLSTVIVERQTCVDNLVHKLASGEMSGEHPHQIVADLENVIVNYINRENDHGDVNTLHDKKTGAVLNRIELF